MKAQEQVQSYARAVYETALEGWLKGLAMVRDRLNGDASLFQRVTQPEASFQQRQAALDSVIPADSSQALKNFLYTMLRNGHLDLLDDVIRHLERLSTKGPGVEVASVTSAIALTPDQAEQFREKLQAQYGSYLEVDFHIDPDILGGVIIQVGDKVLDASVASKLTAMRDRLALR